MGIITIVVIIWLIIVICSNKELQKENERLIKQVKRLAESRNELLKISGLTLQDIEKNVNNNSTGLNNEKLQQSNVKEPIKEMENFKSEQIVKSPKIEKSKEETKNNFILMTGAFLIVLAAIVFLTSMWDTIGDVFKVGILTLLVGVFLGISKIAKDKFNLPNTANTFFYISMAYIPVLALAIYLINLASEYLQTSQEKNIYWLITCMIMGAIYGLIAFKTSKKLLCIGSLIMQVLAVIFGACIFTESFTVVLACMIAYNLILTIVNLHFKSEDFFNIINTFCVVTLMTLLVVNLFTIIFALTSEMTISVIVATLLQIINLLIYAKKTEKLSYILLAMLNMFILVFEIISLEELFEISYITKQIIMLITAVVLFGLGIFSKSEKIQLAARIAIYVFLGLISFSTWNMQSVPAYVVLFIASAISILILQLGSDKKYGYLHAAMITGIIGSLLVYDDLIKYEIAKYMMLLTATVLYIVSLFTTDITRKISKIYTNVALIMSMMLLSNNINIVQALANIVSVLLFARNIKNVGASEYWNLAPLILLLPSIYLTEFFVEQPYLMQVVSILIITYFTFLSIKDKKFNVYSIVTYIYWMAQAISLDINKYVNTILFGVISALQVLSYKDGAKNAMKIMFYLTILVLYNMIMIDLNVEMVSIISIGYLAVLGLITRNSIHASNPSLCKIVEYIGFSLIYLWGISSYTGSLDAVLFMGLLIGIIIFTYSKKYGPIFLCSVLAEIVMAFNVTKEFWMSIPWWIYLLVGGAILISFAVRNEVKEKTEGNKLKDTIKQISNKLDM
ncbi:MAG: hypothetical protein IKK43_01535 [Clostridia bacterium]|nr:hypothetical protein [Clostridia bacterium]